MKKQYICPPHAFVVKVGAEDLMEENLGLVGSKTTDHTFQGGGTDEAKRWHGTTEDDGPTSFVDFHPWQDYE